MKLQLQFFGGRGSGGGKGGSTGGSKYGKNIDLGVKLEDLVTSTDITNGKFKKIGYGEYQIGVGKQGFEGSGSALRGTIVAVNRRDDNGPYTASFQAFDMPNVQSLGMFNNQSAAKKAVKNTMKDYLKYRKGL